jgi:NAD(P)-dependent dehydrogenase (short-subunit alcohol dehydrogenase family)
MAHPPHGLCKTKRLSLRVAAPASERRARAPSARAGAAVGVNYCSKASAADDLVREIRDQGGEAVALKADVSRDDEVRTMFDRLVEAFGRIDILVANAGIQKDSAITDMSLEDWRAVLDINLTGQFLCVREAIRRFLAQGAHRRVESHRQDHLHELGPRAHPLGRTRQLCRLEGWGHADDEEYRPGGRRQEDPGQQHRAGRDQDQHQQAGLEHAGGRAKA